MKIRDFLLMGAISCFAIFTMWEMSKGNWLLSSGIIGVLIILAVLAEHKKLTTKRFLGGILAFVIIFALLALLVWSTMDNPPTGTDNPRELRGFYD